MVARCLCHCRCDGHKRSLFIYLLVEFKKKKEKHTWGSRRIASRAPAAASLLWCDGGGGDDVATIVGLDVALSVVVVVAVVCDGDNVWWVSFVRWWWWSSLDVSPAKPRVGGWPGKPCTLTCNPSASRASLNSTQITIFENKNHKIMGLPSMRGCLNFQDILSPSPVNQYER